MMLAVAHRGYSSAYPENTALAYDKAIAAGADFIETDVRLTRDGQPVCWHDADLSRLTGGPERIAELDLQALKAVPLPQGQSILTLAEVLAIARGRVHVMLDVKIATNGLLNAVMPLIESTAMTEEIIYGARTLEHLKAVKQRSPRIGLLGMPAKPALADDYLRLGVRAIRYWEDEVTAAHVRQARDAGSEVWVTAGLRDRGEAPGYTTPERAAALMRKGVAALLVNDPQIVTLARAQVCAEQGAGE